MTPSATFRRYLWLVDLLYRNGLLTRELIDHSWEKSYLNYNREKEIPRRTFCRMLDAIRDIFEIDIVCNKKAGNVYYIDNLDSMDNSALRYLVQLFSISNLLHESKRIQSRIVLEDVPKQSNKYLQEIVEALDDNIILQITYQGFTMHCAYTFDIQPYCLRHYRQRWYLLAKRVDNGNMRLFALDRMQDARKTKRHFNLPADFDAKEYFSRYVGAMPEDKPVEQVIVKANEFRSNYLRSLPLHHSQCEPSEGVFEYKVVPTADFIQELRAMGADIVVVKPQWLAKQMKEDAQKVLKAYQ